MYGSWDRLANISASIDILDHIHEKVSTSLTDSYRGTTHTDPDTSDLVWRVANKAKELNLSKFQKGREGNDLMKPTVDILAAGERLLKSSTLATFNKKVRSLVSGIVIDEEIDDIPPMDLDVNLQHDNEAE